MIGSFLKFMMLVDYDGCYVLVIVAVLKGCSYSLMMVRN